jgi:hypothetical protein
MKYKVEYLSVADRDIVTMSEALADYPNKAKRRRVQHVCGIFRGFAIFKER